MCVYIYIYNFITLIQCSVGKNTEYSQKKIKNNNQL